MSTHFRLMFAAAALLGLSGVALGAFGAHALKDRLLQLQTLSSWQTAVLYHLLHAVALAALGLAQRTPPPPALSLLIFACWTAGVLLFSGSLYVLALGGPRVLGPVTPVGGLLLLAGWTAALVSAFRS